MKWLAALGVLALAALAAVLALAPQPYEEKFLQRLASGDAERGEAVFWAGGCASCHAADGATGDAKLVLSGGHALKTPFGTFRVPNISTDETHGIGGWDVLTFASAMKRGVAPDGSPYYPSFPYTQYARMSDADVADLWAYMQTLPADETPSQDHDLPFPYNIRFGLKAWQALYLNDAPVTEPSDDAQIERGRYLVEGAGHCGACHTPRRVTGGLDQTRWLAGAPAIAGAGRSPNITPHESGLASWSSDEIVEVLTSGFTPEFDSLGGTMADVVDNLARLPASDRKAIAAYLQSLPALEDASR